MDITKGLQNDQGYDARGVVARINKIGDAQVGFMLTPVYQFITLDCGKGQRGKVVKFVGPAPRVIDEVTNEEYLDFEGLKEGDIVVNPGLLYKTIEWTDALYAEHLKALATYKPKDILIADAPSSDEQAVDLGTIDLTTDTDTKHLISKEAHKTVH